MSSDYHVGAFVLAHARPWLLPLIVEQVTTEFKGFVDITLNRPSADVLGVVDRLSANKHVRVFESPVDPLQPGAGGDHFMEVRQFQLEKLRERQPRYGVLWDDDHVLAKPQEGRYWMAKNFDLIYVTKRFLWDDVRYYNTRMPDHNSVFFFKMLEGDCFPSYESGRIIHAPVMVHDSPDSRKAQMSSHLLDMGYLWQEERERVFRRYVESGKLDDVVRPLVMPPTLERVPRRGHKYWHNRIEEELKCLSRDKTP